MRIILGKINVRADFISGIVLVLTDVFIASYGIANCEKKITRGSVVPLFNDWWIDLRLNEFSCNRLPDDLGCSYADVFCIDLVPIPYDWHWHPPNGELIKRLWLGMISRDELSLELGLIIPNTDDWVFKKTENNLKCIECKIYKRKVCFFLMWTARNGPSLFWPSKIYISLFLNFTHCIYYSKCW